MMLHGLLVSGWVILAAAVAAGEIESGVNSESLISEDIRMLQGQTYLRWRRGEAEAVLTYGIQESLVDYLPSGAAAVFQKPADREETRHSLSASYEGEIRPDVLWHGQASGYSGYNDFRAIWIDEYQQQTFGTFREYKEIDPYGWNIMLGGRWDYLGSSAFVKGSVFAGSDCVSPQWDPQPDGSLDHSRIHFATFGTRLELEAALTTRLRSNNKLAVIGISDRAARWSLETSNNYALADRWVLRWTAGTAFENPDYSAYWTTLAAEWDYERRWFLGVTARLYHDAGEVGVPVLNGVDAPPADTFGIFANLRWVGEKDQVNLGLGPYWSFHDQLRVPSQVAGLYQDRHWLWIQLAYSRTF